MIRFSEMPTHQATAARPRIVGRYALYDEIASGGMGVVRMGRLVGPGGFFRTVAIKCLHSNLARDPEFVLMFLEEARLAARVVHPNVVPTIDVVATEGEVFLVMEYVKGESLSVLLRTARAKRDLVPPPIAVAIVSNVLHGLHAAHETKGERQEPLGIVHRDVSPQNVLVGVDGVARLLDFGVAKAADRTQTTREGRIKGKIGYMPPEQLRGERVTRQADVYAAAVVLWETLAGRRLFPAETEASLFERVLFGTIDPPSKYVPNLPSALEAVVMRAVSRVPTERFATAREMVVALQAATAPAVPNEVGEWVERYAADVLARRTEQIASMESGSGSSGPTSGELASSLAANAPRESRVPTVDLVPQGDPADPPQMSTISVSLASNPGTASRRSRNVLAGITLAVAATAVCAGLLMRRGSPVQSSVGAAQSASAPAIDADPSSLAPASTMTAVIAPAAPSASDVPPGTADASTGRAPRVVPASVLRPRPPKNDCDPPYTRLPSGVRVYKRECL
jgi:serine/threonine-protein kinase